MNNENISESYEKHSQELAKNQNFNWLIGLGSLMLLLPLVILLVFNYQVSLYSINTFSDSIIWIFLFLLWLIGQAIIIYGLKETTIKRLPQNKQIKTSYPKIRNKFLIIIFSTILIIILMNLFNIYDAFNDLAQQIFYFPNSVLYSFLPAVQNFIIDGTRTLLTPLSIALNATVIKVVSNDNYFIFPLLNVKTPYIGLEILRNKLPITPYLLYSDMCTAYYMWYSVIIIFVCYYTIYGSTKQSKAKKLKTIVFFSLFLLIFHIIANIIRFTVILSGILILMQLNFPYLRSFVLMHDLIGNFYYYTYYGFFSYILVTYTTKKS